MRNFPRGLLSTLLLVVAFAVISLLSLDTSGALRFPRYEEIEAFVSFAEFLRQPQAVEVGIKRLWKPKRCFTNSRSYEELYVALSKFSSLNRSCVAKWFYDIPKKCFMYASGTFSPVDTSRDISDNQRHSCVMNTRGMDMTKKRLQRSHVISRMLKQESLRFEPEEYNCDEELPLGFVDTSLGNAKQVDLPPQWYRREEIFERLKGRALVFRGNSMTRQVFLRMIFFIRGRRNFAEHYAHRDMIYGFDLEQDVWEICMRPRSRKCTENNSVTRTWNSLDEVALLYLEFGEGPLNRTAAANSVLSSSSLASKTRVVGTLTQETRGSRVEPNWFFARYENGRKLEKMHLELHPWYRQELFDLGWPKKNRVLHNKPNGTCTLKNDAHFMCGLEPRFVFTSRFTPANTVVKMPLNGDCSDPFNLNVVQRFMMFVFDERVRPRRPPDT